LWKCVFGAQACERHTSHSDSETKIIKFGAFLPPWWSLQQNNRVHKKLGVCQSE
jgi:hypothetical protein